VRAVIVQLAFFLHIQASLLMSNLKTKKQLILKHIILSAVVIVICFINKFPEGIGKT
jgi:hypothetical protein